MGNFDLEDFVSQPSVDKLDGLLKDDWIMLACQYKIVVRSSWRNKIASTVTEKLVEQEIIDESAYDLCDDSNSLLELKN